MEVSKIIAEIDTQIAKLQQARTLLSGAEGEPTRRPGRPKGSGKSASHGALAKKSTGRKLSAEGRKRIADAMKRRWAEKKKTSTK